MEYAEKYHWIKKHNLRYIVIIPILTLIMVFTNNLHGFFWSNIYFERIFEKIYIYKYERGFWFTVNFSYIYLLFLAGLVIFSTRLKETHSLKYYFPVILGVVLPLISNILYITRVTELDYTPAAFSFTCICFAWAIISGFLEKKMAIAETIHKNMEEGIILIDEKLQISSINPYAGKIVGLNGLSGDARAEKLIFFWNELKPRLVENANEYFEINLDRNQEIRWYGIHLYSINKESNISGWLVSLFDITEKKQNEEAMRLMDKEARKAAETANIAKGNFLANMSHEIRTPMNGIIGFVDLLAQTPLAKEQYDYLNEIRNASDALLYMINDVLDFSKIEAEKLELECIDFNLHNIIENAVTLIAPGAFNKGVELHSEIMAGVPEMVKGDPARLRQVFNNLLNNALKFTKSGDISVSGELLKREENRVFLRFKVSDSGIGMSQAVMSNLFIPFTQADSSTTRNYGGTGLGLAICKKIIEMMDGNIKVESIENFGTVFTFEVGFEQGHDIERVNYADISGMTVLIVDDNRTNRRIFREYLEGAGCSVTEARNGNEAIQNIEENQTGKPVDIAIIDYNMQEMNGFELGERLLKLNLQCKPKIILASSITQIGDGKRAIDSGFNGYLPKPVKRKELLSTISAVVGIKGIINQNKLVTRHTLMEDAVKDRKLVLLVEDTEANRKLTTIMLKKLGCDCEVAVNGANAVDACNNKKYDIILMDCQMPVMDGYEATSSIKSGTGLNTKTPIVAMTANALEGDREKCLEAGMDDYISKPINIKTLEEIIKKWLFY
jgi:Signal transduction histidine kinase